MKLLHFTLLCSHTNGVAAQSESPPTILVCLIPASIAGETKCLLNRNVSPEMLRFAGG
jgi:hypothetical protein